MPYIFVSKIRGIFLKNDFYLDSTTTNELSEFVTQIDHDESRFSYVDAIQLLANVQYKQKKYALAIRNYLKAYNYYTKFSKTEFPYLEDYYFEYGSLYYFFKEYRTAVSIFLDAWNNIPHEDFGSGRITKVNTIGLCYRNLGIYDSALYFFQIADSIATVEKQPIWNGIISGNIGDMYASQGRIDEAIDMLMKNIEISEQFHEYGDLSHTYSMLAKLYLNKNDKKKALELANLAYMNYHKRFTKDYFSKVKVYPNIARAFGANGLMDLAFHLLDTAYMAADSVQKKTSMVMIAGVQEKLELEKQNFELEQKETELVNQKRFRNVLIVGFIIVLIFSSVIFIQRNRIKTEMQRSDELLLNILPSEVADDLKKKGKSDARLFENTTVLFTDFEGFTKISENLTPSELVSEINRCFTAFDMIIEKHGLEKIKTIGDAYLAVAGLPNEMENHAECVAKAAVEIRDFVTQQGGKFKIRIGIHSGPVVAGIVGLKKYAYDIWGDTVNTAARMEQNCESGKINISETTYALIQKNHRCAYRGEIDAKGKGEMKMYYLEA